MIRSLELQNYRRFRQFKVNDLAEVNLFVGRNNVGKTSLLEAVALYQSSVPISTLKFMANRRRELGFLAPESERGEFREVPNISHAFFGHKVEPKNKISILDDTGLGVSFEVHEWRDFNGQSMPRRSQNSLLLTSSRNGAVAVNEEVTHDGFLLDLPSFFSNTKSQMGTKNSILVPSEGLSRSYLAVLYNEVIRDALEANLAQAVKILDPDVTGVFFLARLDDVSTTSSDILIGRNGSERTPIGSFGDGMMRLLTLALSLVNARKGFLLVDEIDTGLHYSTMPDLWKLILHSSIELEVQTFATTHSLDCVRGLHIALEREPALAERVAVHKIDSRLDFAVTFTGNELMVALRNDLELR